MDITVFNYTFHNFQWSAITWENFYNLLGIKDFIYFISSPSIQDAVFPVKLLFICFTIFFFCAVIWFYVNSSYIKYKFFQDTSEFLFKGTSGQRQADKNWKKIKRRIDSGTEPELKLAMIEADDYLYETMQGAGFEGVTFEELVQNADAKKITDVSGILQVHQVRNSIVYDPAYNLDLEGAKEMLALYERAIKNIASA